MRSASNEAIDVYRAVTGQEVPDLKGTYAINGKLDKKHGDTNISGYLFFSDDKRLMYKLIVFPGDKAYVESCNKITGWNRKKILDFTDKLSNPSYADKISQDLLEKILSGEN